MTMRAPAVTLSGKRVPVRPSLVLAALAATAGFVWLALKDFAPNPFHPHGYCYLWQPSIVGLLVASDLSIWLSYTSIAGTLAWFVFRGRHAIPFERVFLAFGGFIVACGFTHLMDVVTLWKATFWLAADVKLVTAIASVATAVALPPLVPRVIKLVDAARLSERRKVELEQAVRLARAEEARFRALFDASPDGLLTIDPAGRIQLVNSRSEAIFGYTRRELVGQPVEMLMSEHLRERHESHRRQFNARPATRTMAGDMNLVARRKDGTLFPVEISLSPLTSSEGDVSVVAVVRDITERRKAEEQQVALECEKDARAEAEAASRAKDELLSVVSHELRTPLNAILGWAVMLRSKHLSEEATGRALEVIERNAHAQRQVVDDLLDVSRIVAGKMPLESETLDVRSIVESAVDSVRPAADAKGLVVETTAERNVPVVHGDPVRLQQVFWNLLSNAVKFTPAGGRVRVSIGAAGSDARVQMTDTGIGIDAKLLPHVFERFRQGDSSTTRAYGGLGLGLALVRHLVEWHRGTVDVRSAGAGKGTTFTVTLPGIAVRGDQPSGEPAPADGGPVTISGITVLVVEDDADNRELLREVFANAGGTVVTAATGRDALERLAERRPDVVVADIAMPDMDGYELIRMMHERGVRVPAIAVTAYGREDDVRRAREAGFDVLVAKPVLPADVLRAVARLARKQS